MKITLLFLTLLCGSLLTAADSSKPTVTGTGLIIDTSKWATIATSHSIVWTQAQSTNEILKVTGIETYSRPKKPEDCKVELYTADGKRWVAKWEEVKP